LLSRLLIASSSMAKTVKLDQSHCNFVFSAQLRLAGWMILFRDPGRASRGLSAQESVLGIFERNGWPIPDIVAILADLVLFVEVDHRYEMCVSSMVSYRANANSIITELNTLDIAETRISRMQLCFCKIGTIRYPQELLVMGLVDSVASFEVPEQATIYTRSS
jgi:hypothetical protein